MNIYNFADLAEVVSVTPAQPMPGPPKKTDDKSFFDVNILFFYFLLQYLFKNEISMYLYLQLRTNRRTYNFCAGDAATAQEWIEKVQACLQQLDYNSNLNRASD